MHTLHSALRANCSPAAGLHEMAGHSDTKCKTEIRRDLSDSFLQDKCFLQPIICFEKITGTMLTLSLSIRFVTRRSFRLRYPLNRRLWWKPQPGRSAEVRYCGWPVGSSRPARHRPRQTCHEHRAWGDCQLLCLITLRLIFMFSKNTKKREHHINWDIFSDISTSLKNQKKLSATG